MRYEQGYRPRASAPALRFGSLVHLGLEAWWLARNEGDPLTAMFARLDASAREPDVQLDPYEIARAHAMLLGYHERWIDAPVEVLAVERRFEAQLVNPETGRASRTFALAGKVDAIARFHDHGGRVYVVEHKTSREDLAPGSPYWRRLRIDSQVSHYHRGAQSLGYDVAGCIYDVLGKPSSAPRLATPVESRKYTKPSKAEPEPRLYAGQRDTDETPGEYQDRILESLAADPARYYQRVEVVRLDADIARHDQDVWAWASAIRDARRTGVHQRSGACFTYGRECEFYEVCTGVGTLDDARFERVENIHPELVESEEHQ